MCLVDGRVPDSLWRYCISDPGVCYIHQNRSQPDWRGEKLHAGHQARSGKMYACIFVCVCMYVCMYVCKLYV